MGKSPVVGKRFRDALVWAAELHEEQRRKGGNVPYVAHLLGVASIVLEHGGAEDQALGGLLAAPREARAHRQTPGAGRAPLAAPGAGGGGAGGP